MKYLVAMYQTIALHVTLFTLTHNRVQLYVVSVQFVGTFYCQKYQ